MNIVEFTGEKPYPVGVFSSAGTHFLDRICRKNVPVAKGDFIIYGKDGSGKEGRELVSKGSLAHEAFAKFMLPHCTFANQEVEKDYPKKKSLADEMNDLANNSFKERYEQAKEVVLKDIKNCAIYGRTKVITQIMDEYKAIIDELIAEDFSVGFYRAANENLLKLNISWGSIKSKEATDA